MSGTFCHPCVRNAHFKSGAAEGTRTPDFLLRRETLYPLSYSRALSALYNLRNIMASISIANGAVTPHT